MSDTTPAGSKHTPAAEPFRFCTSIGPKGDKCERQAGHSGSCNAYKAGELEYRRWNRPAGVTREADTAMWEMDDYRLPDGRIVRIDSGLTQRAQTIDFTLKGGEVVTATRDDFSGIASAITVVSASEPRDEAGSQPATIEELESTAAVPLHHPPRPRPRADRYGIQVPRPRTEPHRGADCGEGRKVITRPELRIALVAAILLVCYSAIRLVAQTPDLFPEALTAIVGCFVILAIVAFVETRS